MTTHPGPTVRTITESEIPAFISAVGRGFLNSSTPPPESTAPTAELMEIEPARTIAAFDGDRVVGTYRSLPREMTVPGGATLPASAVTAVTVLATHRRRGLLTRMMDLELSTAARRGDAVAILDAAEHGIYGRFGFGPAAGIAEWSVDVTRAGAPRGLPADGGRVEFATPAEVREHGPALFDRVRLRHPGAINRTDVWWRNITGELPHPAFPWKEPFYALYRDASGRVDGLLIYHVKDDDQWQHKLPAAVLSVSKGDFATPQAEAALWRFALSVDWVATVRSGLRAQDDVLPQLLGDPRAARITTQADWFWLRVLDAPAALSARAYNTTGSLVLRVTDPAGYTDGTFRLAAATDPGASTVTPADPADADLALDVAELGSLYLGGESAVRLASLGRVTELRPGAAARTDLLFRTPRMPWCPDTF